MMLQQLKHYPAVFSRLYCAQNANIGFILYLAPTCYPIAYGASVHSNSQRQDRGLCSGLGKICIDVPLRRLRDAKDNIAALNVLSYPVCMEGDRILIMEFRSQKSAKVMDDQGFFFENTSQSLNIRKDTRCVGNFGPFDYTSMPQLLIEVS